MTSTPVRTTYTVYVAVRLLCVLSVQMNSKKVREGINILENELIATEWGAESTDLTKGSTGGTYNQPFRYDIK